MFDTPGCRTRRSSSRPACIESRALHAAHARRSKAALEEPGRRMSRPIRSSRTRAPRGCGPGWATLSSAAPAETQRQRPTLRAHGGVTPPADVAPDSAAEANCRQKERKRPNCNDVPARYPAVREEQGNHNFCDTQSAKNLNEVASRRVWRERAASSIRQCANTAISLGVFTRRTYDNVGDNVERNICVMYS